MSSLSCYLQETAALWILRLQKFLSLNGDAQQHLRRCQEDQVHACFVYITLYATQTAVTHLLVTWSSVQSQMAPQHLLPH